jgi:serine/threonine protein phosphatase PrpC
MDHPRNVSSVRRLHWSGHTDCGHVRANNEDSFLALRFNAQELHYLGKVGESPTGPHDFVFAISDGMGGAHAGEFASRIAVDKITHLLPRSFKHSALGMEAGFEDIFEELFAQIHKALVFVGDSDEEIRGMQATLSLCWFTPGWLYYGHIGDSRIYYLPKGATEMKQLSQDDTFVGWLQRTGQINEREARHHPRRTALQKALGGGNQFVDPQVGAVACEPGDTFLLCTDGLYEGLYDSNLYELLRHPDVHAASLPPARRLVEASLERAGKDNTTAVVIEMQG